MNNTETGYAWFHTIAFYVDTQPTDSTGANWKYSIKNNEQMYFNVSTIKGYKSGYWSSNTYTRYIEDDYINTTITDLVLRRWDSDTREYIEYQYPEDLNVTSTAVNGNALVNMTYINGNWPSGYYNGELILNNSDGETSRGWLWFQARPFRVSLSTATYEIDSDVCANTTLDIYEPYWYESTLLAGNYSILDVYEDIWSGNGYSRIDYTNFTNSTFNASTVVSLCPNDANWGAGNWGGYHYLRVRVKDNVENTTETGWLSFRAVPFAVSWGSVSGGTNQLSGIDVNISASVTKASDGTNNTGNLTRLFQWRWDNYRSTLEEYNFMVGDCDTRNAGETSCEVNGTQTVTVFPPSGGWKLGYNYIQSEWKDSTGTAVKDWRGFNFNGQDAYNGYFTNSDENGNWKYYFEMNESLTTKLHLRDTSYNQATANVTGFEYAYSGTSCWSDSCRTYTTATYSIVGNDADNTTISNSGVISVTAPSGGWARGRYSVRATVTGTAGSATIRNGQVQFKNFTKPTANITVPEMNETFIGTSFPFSATTSADVECYLYSQNFDDAWWCNGWNSSNGSISSGLVDACNTTKYGYNGSKYYTTYVSATYKSDWNYTDYTWGTGSFLSTGGRTHTYTFDTTNWPTQHYSIRLYCYDEDYNSAEDFVTFLVNTTVNDTTPPAITINSPLNQTYSTTSIDFNVTLNEGGDSCLVSVDSGANKTMTQKNSTAFGYTNATMVDGSHNALFNCNDTSSNMVNSSVVYFSINTSIDDVSPTFSSLNVTPSSPTFNATDVYFFNVTLTEATGIDTVFIEFKGNNYTAFNTSSVYYYNLTGVGGGSHSYYWWANDTSGNTNRTVNQEFNVSAAAGTIQTFINNTRANQSTLTVNGTYVWLNATLMNGTGKIELYFNSIFINNGSSPIFNNTEFNISGLFEVKGVYPGNENYTTDNESWYVNVSVG